MVFALEMAQLHYPVVEIKRVKFDARDLAQLLLMKVVVAAHELAQPLIVIAMVVAQEKAQR